MSMHGARHDQKSQARARAASPQRFRRERHDGSGGGKIIAVSARRRLLATRAMIRRGLIYVCAIRICYRPSIFTAGIARQDRHKCYIEARMTETTLLLHGRASYNLA